MTLKIITALNRGDPSVLKNKVEVGIERGIDDVEAGRYNEMTPEYLVGMKERFELRQE